MALLDVARVANSTGGEIERLWTLELNLGPVGYFAALTGEENEMLAVGAANVLLDQGLVPEPIRDRMVRLASYQSVQLRAFVTAEYDYERAHAVLATPLRPTDALVKRQLAANCGFDPSEMMAIGSSGSFAPARFCRFPPRRRRRRAPADGEGRCRC